MDFEERQSLRNRKVQLNAYLPLTLVEVIDRYAEVYGGSRGQSDVIGDLLRDGLRVAKPRIEAEKGK